MATRAQAREAVVTLLYAKDIGNDNIEDFLDEILEDTKIRNKQKDFAISLYNGVKANMVNIDEQINKYLKEWELEKIGNVERAILRLGAYEIFYSDLDGAIVINEAVEIAKNLAGDSAPKLINAVLDSIKNNK